MHKFDEKLNNAKLNQGLQLEKLKAQAKKNDRINRSNERLLQRTEVELKQLRDRKDIYDKMVLDAEKHKTKKERARQRVRARQMAGFTRQLIKSYEQFLGSYNTDKSEHNRSRAASAASDVSQDSIVEPIAPNESSHQDYMADLRQNHAQTIQSIDQMPSPEKKVEAIGKEIEITIEKQIKIGEQQRHTRTREADEVFNELMRYIEAITDIQNRALAEIAENQKAAASATRRAGPPTLPDYVVEEIERAGGIFDATRRRANSNSSEKTVSTPHEPEIDSWRGSEDSNRTPQPSMGHFNALFRQEQDGDPSLPGRNRTISTTSTQDGPEAGHRRGSDARSILSTYSRQTDDPNTLTNQKIKNMVQSRIGSNITKLSSMVYGKWLGGGSVITIQ